MPNRRKKYQTILLFAEENNEKMVIKKAGNEEAGPFLNEIINRERLARKFFSGKAEVILGNLTDKGIYYPYLPYPTLEELIAGDIKNGNAYGASLIGNYINFLFSLPTKECLPQNFFDEFQIKGGKVGKPLCCLESGPIDLIPCNILINNNEWHIIDNEWFYEFPIPIEFVLFRGILSLVYHLQEEIKRLFSDQSNNLTLFSGYADKRILMPHLWVRYLRSINLPLRQLYYWNEAFERKVNKLNRNMFFLKLKDGLKKMVYEISGSSDILHRDIL